MTLFFVFLLLALWHYTVEAIIAPALRLMLRHRLFTLRDQLRMIQIERGPGASSPDVSILHDGINYYLSKLDRITPYLLAKTRIVINENKRIRSQIEKRREIVATSRDQRIQEISEEIDRVLRRALLANVGGWMIYVLPILAIRLTYDHMMGKVTQLFFTPERCVSRILNHGTTA